MVLTLFGTEERNPSNKFIVGNGNYKAQVISFKAKLRAEEAAAEKAANAEGNRTPPLPSSPTPPLQQPDHPISISVSYHTSRTIVVSTQVTTLVNSTTSPPKCEVECEVTKAPPPAPKKATRPVPKKKGKSSKTSTTTTDVDADTIPAQPDLPGRTLRERRPKTYLDPLQVLNSGSLTRLYGMR